MPTAHAVIMAAGSGSRFGSAIPKQFCQLLGMPVVVRTVRAMRNALPKGSRIIIVLNPQWVDTWTDIARLHSLTDVEVALGGSTRWESVKNALNSLDCANPNDIVLIHDGARPLITADLIGRVTRTAATHGSAIPVTPLTESSRQLTPEGSIPVDRALFRAVQTPQAFPLGKLIEAYQLPYSPQFTDDASVMAAAGAPAPQLVEGDSANIKITNPGDLEVAEALISALPRLAL